jgi:hypothetical protein
MIGRTNVGGESGMKQIPKFATEAQEFEFWSTADSTRYFDWSRAERVKLPNLKRSSHRAESEAKGGKE